MKNILIILVLAIIPFAKGNAANCDTIILSDDFSSSTNWQSEGNGDVNISNGTCNFANVYNGSPNRVYRSLNSTLSNNNWKAECMFSILTANPLGNGTSVHIIALTEGNYEYESTQNGLEVFITSADPTDNNINNWYFGIGYNKGGILHNCIPRIYAGSSIGNYYIRFERLAMGMVQLSVFTDSTFITQLSGSPITFDIDPTIAGLNTVQHATCSIGSFSRLINATVDNDLICSSVDYIPVCNYNILTDDFSSSANWQSEGNGDVNISNGKCNFSNVCDGSPNRVYRSLNTTLSDNYWKAECSFSILNANPPGHGTSDNILTLTDGTLDYENSQNAIVAFITSSDPTDNDINNWYFGIGYNKGSGGHNCISRIYANSSISSYYIRLERIGIGLIQLSVFTDSAFSTDLPGSPIAFEIDSTITGLNTVQHATCTIGSPARLINATVDNDLICEQTSTGINETVLTANNLSVYPNPACSYITIRKNNKKPDSFILTLRNIQGQAEISKNIVFENTYTIDLSNLTNGMYFLTLHNDKDNYTTKVVIEK
jgi:hypothetical protein